MHKNTNIMTNKLALVKKIKVNKIQA